MGFLKKNVSTTALCYALSALCVTTTVIVQRTVDVIGASMKRVSSETFSFLNISYSHFRVSSLFSPTFLLFELDFQRLFLWLAFRFFFLLFLSLSFRCSFYLSLLPSLLLTLLLFLSFFFFLSFSVLFLFFFRLFFYGVQVFFAPSVHFCSFSVLFLSFSVFFCLFLSFSVFLFSFDNRGSDFCSLTFSSSLPPLLSLQGPAENGKTRSGFQKSS